MDRIRIEVVEAARRLKRIVDKYFNRKRILIAVICVIFLLLYGGPRLLNLLFGSDSSQEGEPASVCLNEKLALYNDAIGRKDIIKEQMLTMYAAPPAEYSVPYIGNGLFGIAVQREARLYIKGEGRGISKQVDFVPLVLVSTARENVEEKVLVDFISGKVKLLQCFNRGVSTESTFYAHRTLPSLLVQEIVLHNPLAKKMEFSLPFVGSSNWKYVEWKTADVNGHRCEVSSGPITLDDNKVLVVAIVVRSHASTIIVNPRDETVVRVLITIRYSEPISQGELYSKREELERLAEADMKQAIQMEGNEDLSESHVNVWKKLWASGFSISESKANNALNGDKINATLYAALSQARSYESEKNIDNKRRQDALRSLNDPDGCYMGHHTLQAGALWKPMPDITTLNSVVETWLLTLEKRGCRELLRGGASGLMQAMVLSFGGLRFTDRHLEFDIHPSELHRDFLFRRLHYGNTTHLNVSVLVGEDDKATLYVALDKSDGEYYACDGGCLDGSVRLGAARTSFPVKLTDPPTAVLYITSDKKHIEDLRHAIHVKEVALAPAHEHHVIALHRHGHSFGGLPTLFWVSVCILIVLFHLFLCRIIMTEFCDNGDKYRRLYSKP